MNAKRSSYGEALTGLRRSFVFAGVFSAGINLLMLTGPLYMLQIYDRVLASGSIPTLMGLFLIIVVLYGFMGLYELMRSRLLSRAAYRLDQDIGEMAFRQRLNGGGTSDALRDLDILRGFLSGPAIRGLFDVPWIPIFLAAIFLVHPLLGWLTVGGAIIVGALAFANRAATKGPMGEAAALDAKERAFLDQSLRSTETIRTLGMQSAITARWRKMHAAGLAQSQTGGDRSDGVSAFSRSFRLLLQSVLLTGGAYLALQQQITAGMIIMVSILSGRALGPVDQVIAQWRAIASAAAAHRRLQTALAPGTATNAAQNVALPEPRGALELINVSKLVPNAQPGQAPILNAINLALDPGDGLCVIGNSAAGKSSLARTLVGAWTPEAGDVRLDGATLDQWDPDALGRRIGYLPQQVDMLPGTVAENISRFDPDATEAKIFAAARAAGVHEMILGLQQGYATQIGVPGHPLSGGQVQRIGLARAVYGQPKLLVLDEPNAHLDSHGDTALTETIRTMRAQGTTVVVMAHRPSLIAAVNKVLILHKGRVAQFGDKEEILRMAMAPVQKKAEAPRKTAAAAAPRKSA